MKSLTFLRTAYWIGIIADAVNGIAMIYPPLLRSMLRLESAQYSVELRSALGMGAALMFGWTALLYWAYLRPVERKGVLLITVFPVIVGLALTTLYGYLNAYIPLEGAVPIWIFQAFLTIVFLSAYLFAPDGQ